MTEFIPYYLGYLVLTAALLATGQQHLARDRYVRICAGVALTLLPFGQAVGNSRLTYPFDRWEMYTRPNPPKRYVAFRVIFDSGVAEEYSFSAFVPWTLRPLRGFSLLDPFKAKLLTLRAACQCDRGDPMLDNVIDTLVRFHIDQLGRRPASFEIYDVDISAIVTKHQETRRYLWSRPAEAK
jgi:hypothetical protein